MTIFNYNMQEEPLPFWSSARVNTPTSDDVKFTNFEEVVYGNSQLVTLQLVEIKKNVFNHCIHAHFFTFFCPVLHSETLPKGHGIYNSCRWLPS